MCGVTLTHTLLSFWKYYNFLAKVNHAIQHLKIYLLKLEFAMHTFKQKRYKGKRRTITLFSSKTEPSLLRLTDENGANLLSILFLIAWRANTNFHVGIGNCIKIGKVFFIFIKPGGKKFKGFHCMQQNWCVGTVLQSD